jgi:ATPase subunit of ABC transporter with duplicated ATPase domains
MGNIVNRVFESSGPEGKVRGTPQQIIDKYNQLARDAQLGNDRVAAENFQQHAEHYLRMLGAAQKDQDARREQQERENRDRQAERDRDRERSDRSRRSEGEAQPDSMDMSNAPQPDLEPRQEAEESSLVETPESQKAEKPKRPRKPRAKKVQPEAPSQDGDAGGEQPSGSDATEAAE